MIQNRMDLPPAASALMERFESRESTIGVVGLGYVGLPLAVVFAEAGFHVVGIDNDQAKIEAISRGESYVEDVPGEKLASLVEQGLLSASRSYDVLEEIDAVSISVPTPLRKTGDPDLSFIISATESLRPVIHPEMVVVLESTTYPGTTREMLLPELEATDLKVGQDLFLAFSPERVDPGRKDWTTKNTPKVIGGVTPVCTAVASSLYGQAIDTIVPVASAEVAEMTKLLENTYRAVNIALVNEVALMCDRLDIDVWEVIQAASTKPFGFTKFTPGPGMGGHCIPIDPLYLSWKLKSLKYTARFIELASEINANMPRYVVRRVQDALNSQAKALKGSKILLLGVAYKPDVSDVRESPALDVVAVLRSMGANVSYFDPHVPVLEHEGWSLGSVPNLALAAGEADCVVVVTNHTAVDYQGLVREARLIFDTRNALEAAGIKSPKVVRL